jgi:hypothetical protein
MNPKNLIIPFLSGGILVATIKYVANVVKNPRIAAAIGAFPIGLFSIYFLTNSEVSSYSINYFEMLIILLIVSMLFIYLFHYLKINKNTSYILSIISWMILTIFKLNYIK